MTTLSKMWVVPVEPGRVALHEVHPAHSGGELLICWDALKMDEEPDPVEVAVTPGVLGALSRRALSQVIPPRLEVAVADPTAEAIESLSGVKGIGASRAKELLGLGINGARALADLTEEAMLSLAKEADTFSLTQLKEWRRQARIMLNG